jgi:hypothetical protein
MWHRAGSLRIASLVATSGQIAGNLPGNISPHVVIPQDHFQGTMTSEAPNVPEIAASIEGRCCRAVSQAMGANIPGQAGGLAQTSNDSADRFPGKSNVRGRLGTVEAMEERAGFVAAGLDPLDQGGGRLIGQGHALFLGPAFPSNPDCGGAAIGSGLDVRSIEVA